MTAPTTGPTPATPEPSAPAPIPAREVDEGGRQRRDARQAPPLEDPPLRGPWTAPEPVRTAPPDRDEQRRQRDEATAHARAEVERHHGRRCRTTLRIARFLATSARTKAAGLVTDAVTSAAGDDDAIAARFVREAVASMAEAHAADAVMALIEAALRGEDG